ncbi:MAG: hypothetical protein LBD74_03520 [Spirochaetaceae bacterium]|jgi:hypothetical protein|nr:hypothetical protein [Spirochaetaceae bacterium]
MDLLNVNPTAGVRPAFVWGQTSRSIELRLLRALLAGAVSAWALLSAACAGLVEKAGDFIDRPGFAGKTLGVYRAEEGLEIRHLQEKTGEGLAITLKAYPGVVFWGMSTHKGGPVYLRELRFLGGSYTGWNQFTVELSGEVEVILQRNSALWQGVGFVERIRLVQGKIRRKTTVLSGEAARTALRNRYERIGALTAWMHDQNPLRDFTRLEGFAAYWKPRLLPELTAPKSRPRDWTTADAVWVLGEQVRWNQAYTERLFPEALRPFRDSGALLRDWEEALSWIYLDYQWDRILQELAKPCLLTRIP